MSSFKVACKTSDTDARWYYNALRFTTEPEALSYAQDLYSRWLMLKAYEIHGSDDQPNYIWSDGTYTRIGEVAAPDPGDVTKIGTASLEDDIGGAKMIPPERLMAQPLRLDANWLVYPRLNAEPFVACRCHAGNEGPGTGFGCAHGAVTSAAGHAIGAVAAQVPRAVIS